MSNRKIDKVRTQRPELNGGDDLFIAFIVACLSSLLAVMVGLYLAVMV